MITNTLEQYAQAKKSGEYHHFYPLSEKFLENEYTLAVDFDSKFRKFIKEFGDQLFNLIKMKLDEADHLRLRLLNFNKKKVIMMLENLIKSKEIEEYITHHPQLKLLHHLEEYSIYHAQFVGEKYRRNLQLSFEFYTKRIVINNQFDSCASYRYYENIHHEYPLIQKNLGRSYESALAFEKSFKDTMKEIGSDLFSIVLHNYENQGNPSLRSLIRKPDVLYRTLDKVIIEETAF